jgi:hypothetical protein
MSQSEASIVPGRQKPKDALKCSPKTWRSCFIKSGCSKDAGRGREQSAQTGQPVLKEPAAQKISLNLNPAVARAKKAESPILTVG